MINFIFNIIELVSEEQKTVDLEQIIEEIYNF